MVQITKDEAYDAVAPDDFPGDAEPERYGVRSTAFDKIISRDPRSFLGSARQEVHRLRRSRSTSTTNTILPDEMTSRSCRPARRQADDQADDSSSPMNARWSLSSILHGEQGALALSASLCHMLRTRARRNTPPTRRAKKPATSPRSPATSRRAGARRCRAARRCRQSVDGDRRRAGGLQEDHRHADAGGRPGHGRLRHALPEVARPAAGQAVPAGDDRRSLPSQVRQDLGRPHDPQTVRRRARTSSRTGRRNASRPCCSTRQSRADAARLCASSASTRQGARAAIMEAFTDDAAPRRA